MNGAQGWETDMKTQSGFTERQNTATSVTAANGGALCSHRTKLDHLNLQEERKQAYLHPHGHFCFIIQSLLMLDFQQLIDLFKLTGRKMYLNNQFSPIYSRGEISESRGS